MMTTTTTPRFPFRCLPEISDSVSVFSTVPLLEVLMYPPFFLRVLYVVALIAFIVLLLDLYMWRP